MDFWKNYPLWAALISWFVAQFLKLVIELIKEKRFSIKLLFSSGGMPSSHSSTVCALTTVIGASCGLASPEFAIAFIFSWITMYDARGVRQEVGKHAQIINMLLEDFQHGDIENTQKHLKELIGHSFFQVLMGAVLGIAIGLIFIWCGLY